jgi:hypothetical protein
VEELTPFSFRVRESKTSDQRWWMSSGMKFAISLNLVCPQTCSTGFSSGAYLGSHSLENLKRAEGMFQEMGMDYWLAKTQEVLGRL